MPTPLKVKKPRKKPLPAKAAAQPARVETAEAPEIPSFYKVELSPTVSAPKIAEPIAKMEEKEDGFRSKKTSLVAMFFVLLILLGVYYFTNRGTKQQQIAVETTKKVITDNLYVPKTDKVSIVSAKTAEPVKNEVPINNIDKNSEVVVAQAKLTVKDAFHLSEPEALKWSADSKLSYIKSLGTVTSDGKSTEWQVVFYSTLKKKSLELIIWVDKIQAQKEVDSSVSASDVPTNWFDSGSALDSLRSMPEFATGTISSINFYFNTDSNDWIYGLRTSVGGTVIHVK